MSQNAGRLGRIVAALESGAGGVVLMAVGLLFAVIGVGGYLHAVQSERAAASQGRTVVGRVASVTELRFGGQRLAIRFTDTGGREQVADIGLSDENTAGRRFDVGEHVELRMAFAGGEGVHLMSTKETRNGWRNAVILGVVQLVLGLLLWLRFRSARARPRWSTRLP
ncbi:hypothetical protein [Micromonospora avicenniae]|uniref:hypothetical protein n=1 Tax=Micromonospora avicenniae TaxID=1198245 RepID=UPI0033264739